MKKLILIFISFIFLTSCSLFDSRVKISSDRLKELWYDYDSKTKDELCFDYYKYSNLYLSLRTVAYDSEKDNCIMYWTDSKEYIDSMESSFSDAIWLLKLSYYKHIKGKEVVDRVINDKKQEVDTNTGTITKEEIEKMKKIIKEFESK